MRRTGVGDAASGRVRSPLDWDLRPSGVELRRPTAEAGASATSCRGRHACCVAGDHPQPDGMGTAASSRQRAVVALRDRQPCPEHAAGLRPACSRRLPPVEPPCAMSSAARPLLPIEGPTMCSATCCVQMAGRRGGRTHFPGPARWRLTRGYSGRNILGTAADGHHHSRPDGHENPDMVMGRP